MQKEREKLLASDEFKAIDNPSRYGIVDFVLYSYHKDSPLIKDYPQPENRRMAAAIKAELPKGIGWVDALVSMKIIPTPEPDENQEESDDLGDVEIIGEIILQNDLIRKVVNLIHYFLQRIQCCNDFDLLLSNQEVFWEWQRMMRDRVETVDDDRKLKAAMLKEQLSSNSEKILERIERLQSKIYGDETALKKDAEKIMRIRPETMAKKTHVPQDN